MEFFRQKTHWGFLPVFYTLISFEKKKCGNWFEMRIVSEAVEHQTRSSSSSIIMFPTLLCQIFNGNSLIKDLQIRQNCTRVLNNKNI